MQDTKNWGKDDRSLFIYIFINLLLAESASLLGGEVFDNFSLCCYMHYCNSLNTYECFSLIEKIMYF